MKNKQLRFIGILLIIGLIASLTLGLAACGSKATTTAALSSITVSPSSPSNLTVGQPRLLPRAALILTVQLQTLLTKCPGSAIILQLPL